MKINIASKDKPENKQRKTYKRKTKRNNMSINVKTQQQNETKQNKTKCLASLKPVNGAPGS